MIYTFDTEFNDTGKEFELISIGIVCEDGRDYYAQNPHYNWQTADPAKYWLEEHVKPGLKDCPNGQLVMNHFSDLDCPGCPWRTPKQMAQDIAKFVRYEMDSPIEFWGFFGAWDWIILLRLFGRVLFDKPYAWPDRINDIAQYADMLGVPIIRDSSYTHNALDDAYWTMNEYKRLRNLHGKLLPLSGL